MRRAALPIATVALTAAVQIPLLSQELVLSRFQTYLDALRIQTRIPGLSVAVVGRTDILWEGAFGYQNLDDVIAARPDTPYHVDGIGQIITAALTLRCVEEGHLSLEDRVRRFAPDSPEAPLSLRELLTHTSGDADDPVFSYQPARLQPIAGALRSCTGRPFREELARLLDRFAMIDSVPGTDVRLLQSSRDRFPSAAALARYTRTLERLATSYVLDSRGRPVASRREDEAPTPVSGLVSTVRDLARLDLAMKADALLRPETLALSWQPPLARAGRPLPHALGWFVRNYSRGRVVWQFGVSATGSSALIMTAPEQWITLILLANSNGLIEPFEMNEGDLLASPFGRLFLSSFVR
jgi:CubicO group peptidase (beta-lactamase class C family)